MTVTVADNDTAQVIGRHGHAGQREARGDVGTAVDNATGYLVQWKSGVEAYSTPATGRPHVTSGSTTNHTIPSLTIGDEYTVRVTATRTGANDGPPSEEAKGTPIAPGRHGVGDGAHGDGGGGDRGQLHDSPRYRADG